MDSAVQLVDQGGCGGGCWAQKGKGGQPKRTHKVNVWAGQCLCFESTLTMTLTLMLMLTRVPSEERCRCRTSMASMMMGTAST